jgi:hypothetical protein
MRIPAFLLVLSSLLLSACHHGFPPDRAVAALQDPDPRVRQHAADSLRAEGKAPSSVIGNLLAALQTEQVPAVRGAILISLGTWGAPQAKPLIDQAVMSAASVDEQRWAGRALRDWMIQAGTLDKGTPAPPGWPYGQPGYPPLLVR